MYSRVCLLLSVIRIAGCALSPGRDSNSSQVCYEQSCIDVEIADTPLLRQRGLMFRDYLPEGSGMFFVFDEEGNYPFWMKNTLIPLDIIWIDSDLRIVDIQTAIPCEADPCQEYYPAGMARYVREVNAGVANRYDIQQGDIVDII